MLRAAWCWSALVAVVGLVVGFGCSKPRAKPSPSPSPSTSTSTGTDAGAGCQGSGELVAGVEVRRVRAGSAPEVGQGDRCITLVRIDPARFRARLLTPKEGGPLPAPGWSEAAKLSAVINATLFLDDGRGFGLMIADGRVINGNDNPKLGGFLALGPRRKGLAEVALFGRDCEGFDLGRVRADYATVVQSYRLLDCAGQPIGWQDAKSYSAAAVGVDRDGWLVLVHVRTPYRMAVLARELATAMPTLRGALFVEGGPEASLLVRAGGREIAEMGSFETDFTENDDNRVFWPLPNVLGLTAVN